MSPKISNLNEADFHHFNLFPIHGAIGYIVDAVLISAEFATRDHVGLPEDVLKEGVLDVQVTTSFEVNNLGNT